MELPQGMSRIMEVSNLSSAADLDGVGAALAVAKKQVRETLQNLTAAQMEGIIEKLENRKSLTP